MLLPKKDKMNYGLLFFAMSKSYDQAERAIKEGADINFAPSDCSVKGFLPGDTALILACKYDDPDMVDLLLNKGANINKGNLDYRTPLMLATISGTIKCMELLVQYGADVNFVSQNSESALGIATSYTDNLQKIKWLIGKGADINLKGMFNSTALGTLSRINNDMLFTSSKLSVVECLLNCGADPNELVLENSILMNVITKKIIHNEFADTKIAIMQAMSRILIQHGADPYFADKNKQSILDVAEESYGINFADMLKNAHDNYLLDKKIQPIDEQTSMFYF